MRLTPEEDAIGDPDDEDDEIDDTLPADLWFRDARSTKDGETERRQNGKIASRKHDCRPARL